MAGMVPAGSSLPDDINALKRLVLAREAELAAAQVEIGRAKARETSAEAMILHLRLAVEKMRRELYGQRSERGARLLDQMELELEELEANLAEDELAAETAAEAHGSAPRNPRRRSGSRRPLPEHLPRERILVPGPTACLCCGSIRLAKLGEDVTETLELVPRSWKVVQHVREKFTCRACEAISQAPAPFHVLPRGFAGPNLLACVLFEKYGQHQPLNRQAERYRQPYAGGDPRRGAGRAHRPAWSPATQTGQAARRQGLRSPSLPARVPGPQHHTTDRSTGDREQPAPRPPSLDRGAHLGLARPLPPTDNPLPATRRPASRIHDPRLCPHLQGTDRPVLSLTLNPALNFESICQTIPELVWHGFRLPMCQLAFSVEIINRPIRDVYRESPRTHLTWVRRRSRFSSTKKTNERHDGFQELSYHIRQLSGSMVFI